MLPDVTKHLGLRRVCFLRAPGHAILRSSWIWFCVLCLWGSVSAFSVISGIIVFTLWGRGNVGIVCACLIWCYNWIFPVSILTEAPVINIRLPKWQPPTSYWFIQHRMPTTCHLLFWVLGRKQWTKQLKFSANMKLTYGELERSHL